MYTRRQLVSDLLLMVAMMLGGVLFTVIVLVQSARSITIDNYPQATVPAPFYFDPLVLIFALLTASTLISGLMIRREPISDDRSLRSEVGK